MSSAGLLFLLLSIPLLSAAESDEKECVCQETRCQCCVDFDVSFIDLGGPGCVQLEYLSFDEGMEVNVTYGENQIRSDVIKGGTENGTSCLELVAGLAGLCASLSGLTWEDPNSQGCLALQPTLLGEPQHSYSMGCFTAQPHSLQFTPNSTSGSDDVSEEALIAAVNESAEEGIAWFSSLLGLSFGNSSSTT